MITRLRSTFGTHFETRDNHSIESLQTQYFKTTKDRLFKYCTQLINEDPEMNLLSESSEHGELVARLVGKKKGLIVFSLISVQPLKTAVDFTINIDRGRNFGYAQTKAQDVYKKVGQQFPAVDKK